MMHSSQLTSLSHVQLVKGDIQSADLIGLLLNEHKIDTVMHFAAQVSTPMSWCNKEPCLLL